MADDSASNDSGEQLKKEILDIEKQLHKERQQALAMLMEREELLEKRERAVIERERELREREMNIEEKKERFLELVRKWKEKIKT